MKFLHSVKNIFLIIFLLVLFLSCKQDKSGEQGIHEVKLDQYPDTAGHFFGINFCEIKFIDIVNQLINKKIEFQYHDFKTGNLISYSGEKIEFKNIDGITTKCFIGRGLDESKIIQIEYMDSFHENLMFRIKLKEDYYEILLKLLNEKLGSGYAIYNKKKYDETTWNPDMQYTKYHKDNDESGSWKLDIKGSSVPICLESVIISKRLQYDDPEKFEKGVCYLEIITRSRDLHVH